MHVVLVSPGWPPRNFANGIVSSVSQFRQAYKAIGHSPQIITRELIGDPGSSDIHNCRGKQGLWMRVINGVFWHLGYSSPLVPPYIEGLRKKINELHRDGKADIVEIEETWGFARRLSRCLPIPIVVRLHGPWFLNGKINGLDVENKDNERRIRLEGKAVAAADGVSAPSASVLNETRKYYGLTLSEAKIIPNPIRCISDNERWSADMCEKNLILFVGRFDRHKGGDIVVRAFGKIASVNPRARLLFCGPDRGFIDNDGIKYSYNDFLDKINLPSTIRERIEFLGQQPSERIETFRRNASVTVVASRYENFGGVLLEAASLGCPVVATDCGGNPEIIKQGETGILVPPNDPNTMADAISVLLGDRVRAAQLGARLWKDVKKRFDPESIAERTMSFYREVISRWRG